eukprot:SAG31_NODE_34003_length_337_cov_2.079832_1_plen_39_part_10
MPAVTGRAAAESESDHSDENEAVDDDSEEVDEPPIPTDH